MRRKHIFENKHTEEKEEKKLFDAFAYLRAFVNVSRAFVEYFQLFSFFIMIENREVNRNVGGNEFSEVLFVKICKFWIQTNFDSRVESFKTIT